jgi:hypothetical protein
MDQNPCKRKVNIDERLKALLVKPTFASYRIGFVPNISH